VDEHDLADLEGGATAIQRPLRATAKPTGWLLSVSDGPDRGKTFTLSENHPAPYLVGQSPTCDIQLADRHVSRRHASIEITSRRLLLTDLDSTNGTHVDGVSIVGAYLRGDETIRIGDSQLRLTRHSVSPSQPPAAASGFGKVVGQSPELTRLYPLFAKLAASDVAVVIEGETGTGKEALAESIHEAGPRASAPFIVFDCTTIPPNLMEAELFGHERGAFTGAMTTRKGLFEQASGGTLLIDEIGDLDLALQPKLLRAIERKTIRRVGGSEPIQVDVRLLAATRRDLDRAVQDGRFRDDLYHRLAIGRVALPPLRKRRGDVAVLARHFWRELGGSPAEPPVDLMATWEAASWPGNVRQLRNAVARWIALGEMGDGVREDEGRDGAVVSERSSQGDVIGRVIAERLPLPLARLRVIEAFESRYIETMLAEHQGNVAKAAEASGIARRYFQILRTGKRRA